MDQLGVNGWNVGGRSQMSCWIKWSLGGKGCDRVFAVCYEAKVCFEGAWIEFESRADHISYMFPAPFPHPREIQCLHNTRRLHPERI